MALPLRALSTDLSTCRTANTELSEFSSLEFSDEPLPDSTDVSATRTPPPGNMVNINFACQFNKGCLLFSLAAAAVTVIAVRIVLWFASGDLVSDDIISVYMSEVCHVGDLRAS